MSRPTKNEVTLAIKDTNKHLKNLYLKIKKMIKPSIIKVAISYTLKVNQYQKVVGINCKRTFIPTFKTMFIKVATNQRKILSLFKKMKILTSIAKVTIKAITILMK